MHLAPRRWCVFWIGRKPEISDFSSLGRVGGALFGILFESDGRVPGAKVPLNDSGSATVDKPSHMPGPELPAPGNDGVGNTRRPRRVVGSYWRIWMGQIVSRRSLVTSSFHGLSRLVSCTNSSGLTAQGLCTFVPEHVGLLLEQSSLFSSLWTPGRTARV